MKKTKLLLRSKCKRIFMLTLTFLLVVPVFSQIPKGRDYLKETLDKFEEEKVFINFQDETLSENVQIVTLEPGKILVIYALGNVSTGYEWMVTKYNKEVLTLQDIQLNYAYAPVEAPGGMSFQRIVFTSKARGDAEIELKFCQRWKPEKSVANSCKIQIKNAGSATKNFAFVPPVQKQIKLEAKDYQVKALPSKFDWRDQGIVTPVKEQELNACWAFGSCAGFEALIKKKHGIERDLSEQFLGSCNELGYSISGGGWWAHDYWYKTIAPGHKAAGAVYEKDVPFLGMDTDCEPADHHEQIEGWAYVTDIEDTPWPTQTTQPTTAQIKEKLYEWGPIPTALSVDGWNTYTGGVLTGHNVTVTNHIVLITGWDDANQCWIVKNSWGADWGEDGYIRIGYGSNACGYFSTYLKYKKTNPRLVYGGEKFFEALANDGAVRSPMTLRLLDGGNFAVSSGSLTEGTHYTASGVPSGLTTDIQIVSQTKVKVMFNGKASSHADANDATVTITFKNAAFTNGNASSVENSTSTVDIDFFDPYKIVYEDIADKTVTTSNVWESFRIDGNSVGIWYSFYYYGDDLKANTFFFDVKCRKALCQTGGIGEHERFLKKVGYGEVIDPNVDYWVQGGDMGKQHRIMNPHNTSWYDSEGYAGIQFKKYGSIVYGWVRFKTAGSSLTVMDFAYNERPMAPISAGMQSEPTLIPVADFRIEEDETYVGVELALTDRSTRVPTSWSWSMPGATPSSSNLQNPKVKYNTPGTYNITLTVSNSAGSNTKTINGIVKVHAASPPVVDFEPAAYNVPKGGVVGFTGTSTNLPNTFSWTLNGGDPNSSTDESVVSTFANTGTFNITHTATNPYGTGSKTKQINVVNVPSVNYCAATSSNTTPATLYIANVKLANMNSTSQSTTSDYEYLSSDFASLKSGQGYTVEVTPNNDWEPIGMGIWIDWNQDGDFSDANETIHTMNGTQVWSKAFTVPTSATDGFTRMRVRFSYYNQPVACGDDNRLNDCKDYTIIVDDQGGSTTNPPPTVSITSPANNATYNAGDNITINATASDSNGSVTKVEFFNGSTLLGTDNTSPYSHTINGAAAGSYSLTAKATDNEGASTTSTAVNVTVGTVSTYCAASGDAGPEHISRVVFGTIDNSSARDNYHDYTGISTSVNKGSSYTLAVTIGDVYNGDKATAWIDWNGDADFADSGEKFALTVSGSSATANIAVPTSASASSTRMRIRVYYNAASDDPCGAKGYGEVEDYTINIGGGTSNEEPSVSITSPANNATFNENDNITINATASDTDGTITKVEFFNGSTLLSTDNSSPYSHTINSAAAGTYTLTAKATDNGGATKTSTVINVTVNSGTPVTYCAAAAKSGAEHISKVVFGSINNSSTRDASGYKDYTSISTSVNKGSSYILTVTIGDVYNNDKATAWFDWNGDGDFSDSGEKFTTTVSGSTATASIIVPATATASSTRMRIRVHYYAASGECGTPDPSYGEVEDYTVAISQPAQGSSKNDALSDASSVHSTTYPNPFHTKANIRFNLSEDSYVKITVYNSTGSVVRTLLGNHLNRGEHEVQFDGSELPVGLYIYNIELGNDILKGTLIKK